MKRFVILAAAFALTLTIPGLRTFAQTPSSTPQPAPAAPSKVYVVNQSSSFFPATDQETGVWQGCGPSQDEGVLEDFNRAHPRVRIVQVFIDAGIPCKAAGAHTFVIVYQGEARIVRRSVRYPMAR